VQLQAQEVMKNSKKQHGGGGGGQHDDDDDLDNNNDVMSHHQDACDNDNDNDAADEAPSSSSLKDRIAKRMASLDRRVENEKKEIEARECASNAMTAHVEEWLSKHKKNIVKLLVHMDEIFPEGFDHDPFSLQQKLGDDDFKAFSTTTNFKGKSNINKVSGTVKKAYHKTLLQVHPDKVRGLTVPQKVRAEAIFEGLSKAYRKFAHRCEKSTAAT